MFSCCVIYFVVFLRVLSIGTLSWEYLAQSFVWPGSWGLVWCKWNASRESRAFPVLRYWTCWRLGDTGDTKQLLQHTSLWVDNNLQSIQIIQYLRLERIPADCRNHKLVDDHFLRKSGFRILLVAVSWILVTLPIESRPCKAEIWVAKQKTDQKIHKRPAKFWVAIWGWNLE